MRTRWGWDIIVWTSGLPTRDITRDQLASEVFPDLRRNYFPLWVTKVQRALGVKVEILEANLNVLESAGAP